MKGRTLVVSLIVPGLWLTTPAPAAAHRLDEYLQATRLSVDLEHVGVEIDLTAGVRVAPDIFGSIDTNCDGQISIAEAEAYGQEVLRSVVLSVDGRPVPLRLLEIRVPQFHDMSLGVGIIRIRASATHSAAGSNRHRLSYVNVHRSESSVYLVNVLVPADPRIEIRGQTRDSAQHGLTVEYSVMPDRAWTVACSLFFGLVMTGVLGFTRCRSRTHAGSTRRAAYGA
jgi:hypothetical protein